MEVDREAVVATFLAESGEHLDMMEEALISLEERPDDDELVATVFRVVHTLKGNASILDCVPLAEFAHLVEGVLERLRDRSLQISESLVGLLLEAVDRFRELVPIAAAGTDEATPAARELASKLQEVTGAAAAPFVGAPQSAESPGADPVPGSELASGRTLRVEIGKLDRLLNLTGELSIARGRLASALAKRTREGSDEALELHHEADRLHQDLQELAMKLRLVRVGPSFRHQIRTVRDLSHAAGKQAQLVIEGEDVEVDTTIVERLRDPVTQMLRNAVVHGIEPAETRKALGKDPRGRITLRAEHRAGSIVVTVADDGAGFNRERIIERARARGSQGSLAELPDDELYRLVFEAGFSTASEVTGLSGRGVGMDVVRRNIEALRGTIVISSEPGRGTTFSVRLPLTLAIIQGFAVGVGEEVYVIPLENVVECVELPEGAGSGGRGVLNLRGEALPFVELRHSFELGGQPPRRQNVVVVHDDQGRAGIVVDALLGETQTVIKPLAKVFHGLAQVSGCAVVGSGRVALILDVPGLFRELRHREPPPLLPTDLAAPPPAEARSTT